MQPDERKGRIGEETKDKEQGRDGRIRVNLKKKKKKERKEQDFDRSGRGGRASEESAERPRGRGDTGGRKLRA